jgi:hypothetical protein
MQNHLHRMTLYQRAVSWTLDIVEGKIVRVLPRRLRQRLRAYIDRAQARLHSRTDDVDHR